MKMVDPHVHMTSRTTDDYQNMADHGIRMVVEPAFWMGQPRTHVGSFEDYFLSLLGWERFRAKQFGIHHYCTLALNPKEANDLELAEGVLALLPLYLERESVVAVGEIGLDDQTPQEEKVMAQQIELAKEFKLPILIHTPHRDKKRGTERCVAIVMESGIAPEMVLIDHNTEDTIGFVRELGFYAGHSIYPETKMDGQRMTEIVKRFGTERIIINSAADWGVSDPLMVPKTAALMKEAGIATADIETIVWRNSIQFFAQSGRLSEEAVAEPPRRDQRELYLDNSVLRGQEPQVDSSL